VRYRSILVLTCLALAACEPGEKPVDSDTIPEDTQATFVEDDGDGFPPDEDCDDHDGAVYPGADELCNGKDDDCDGLIDEDDAVDAGTWYADADGDGYGDPAVSVLACEQPEDHVEDDTDCDDADAAVNPGAEDLCDDLDDDCDGEIDEDAEWLDYYMDNDLDGFGDGESLQSACEQPSGFVLDSTDCEDEDAAVNPDADELCNGVDDDCDDQVDEDALDATTWYEDGDMDGYGDADSSTTTCDQASGWVSDSSDCDDEDADSWPGADEYCDGHDDDCDGDVDEDDAVDATTWYADTDGDGFGDPDASTVSCSAPAGFVAPGASSDCDDSDAAVNPDADELCDGIDDDCDGTVDEDDAVDATTWYDDVDGDGYGSDDTSTVSCSSPTGSSATGGDCDDDDAAVNPGAAEDCNGADDDCDGVADEGLAYSTWYQDADGDGYGSSLVSTSDCTQPSGYVSSADGGDCDDGDAAVNPGASESCNEIDDDCDGTVDESVTSSFYDDADGDGYGDAASSSEACSAPSGTVTDSSDCDDMDPDIHPGAAEVCNEIDDDCDSSVDEGATGAWYVDSDGDGYGDASTLSEDCEAPTGYVADGTDCDDSDAAVNPGASEVCTDGVDDDCDGTADDGCLSTVEHCGTISSDETWSASSLHQVTCDVWVQGSSRPTLTVEDGAQVLFDAEARLLVGWSSYGDLQVEGAASGASFTSSQSSPAAGDWGGLYIGSYDEGSELTGLTVEYAGGGGYGGLYLYYASVDISDSVFQYNDNAGLYLVGAITPEITGTLISDNEGDGISATTGGISTAGGATFVDNELTGNAGYPVVIPAVYAEAFDASSSYLGNDDDYLVLMADTVDNDGTWQALDVPWLVDGDVYIQGSSRPEVEIEDGAELYFDSDSRLLVGWSSYGELQVLGSSLGVIMSSYDSSPSPGDWYGLQFGSYDQGSALEGLYAEYGGGNGYGLIYDYYASIELSGCALSQSSNAGYYGQGAFPAISGSSFTDNDGDGVALASSSGLSTSGSPSFSGNELSRNGDYPMSLPAEYLGELADDNAMEDNGEPYIEVLSDTVASSAEWRDLDAPYLFTGDVNVQGSSSPDLEILDGVEIYFDSGVGLYVGWSSYAALDVQGGSAGVLLSSADSSPAEGDWLGLVIGSYASTAVIEGLTLEYGGDNGYGGLYLYYSEAEIIDSTFRYNDEAGIYLSGGTLELQDSTVEANDGHGIWLSSAATLSGAGTPSFTGNLIVDNSEHPLVLPAEYLGELDASSSYADNGEDSVLVTTDTVSADATWQALDVPYRFEGTVYIQGSSSPDVTVEPGATLEFESNVALYVGWSSYGSMEAAGSSGAPVTFTSADPTPGAGDWMGIAMGSYCDTASMVLDNVVVEYGGDNGYGNIYSYYCAGSITDSTVSGSSNCGIYVTGTAPTVSGISYADNASGDLCP